MSGHIYSREEERFLIDNVKGITIKELTDKFNKQFNMKLSESAISNRKHKLGLSSGINSGQFKKENIPWNKGVKGYMGANKTSFKKGNIPKNYRPVGSERITRDGYIEIKTADPNKWELKHRYIYEKEYGNIPDGHVIIFADGNKLNFDKNNLIAISRSENLILNGKSLRFNNQELTKSGILIAKVVDKINERKRK